MNHIFKKRYEAFQNGFDSFKVPIKVYHNVSGQYFLFNFPKKINQYEMIKRALDVGVKVYDTMQFWQEEAECPHEHLFLGFSKIELENIPDCIERLKKAWDIIEIEKSWQKIMNAVKWSQEIIKGELIMTQTVEDIRYQLEEWLAQGLTSSEDRANYQAWKEQYEDETLDYSFSKREIIGQLEVIITTRENDFPDLDEVTKGEYLDLVEQLDNLDKGQADYYRKQLA